MSPALIFFVMLNQLQSFPASVSVEVNVTSTVNGAQFNFPDVPELRKNPCIGFVAYSNDSVTIAPSGEDVITTAIARNAYVTILNTKNFAFISGMPYGYYETIRLSGAVRAFDKPTYLNLQQSFLTFYGTSALPAGTPRVCLFDFFYIPQNDK